MIQELSENMGRPEASPEARRSHDTASHGDETGNGALDRVSDDARQASLAPGGNCMTCNPGHGATVPDCLGSWRRRFRTCRQAVRRDGEGESELDIMGGVQQFGMPAGDIERHDRIGRDAGGPGRDMRAA